MVQLVLQVPIAGSLWLFLAGALLYLFSVTALGILIATFTTSMAQFGLLCIPILVILQMLSGSSTPIETMPDVAAKCDAARSHHPFRQLLPGRSLSRGWSRNRMAATPGDRLSSAV